MILMFVKLILVVILAFLAGKLISKLKLPAILGWLIAGMLLGPHAFSLMNQEILDAGWYQVMIHVLECGVGLMIGTELVWNKIKKSGKAIVITTLTQSLGTFLVVSLVFGVVFYITDVPLYLCFVFGGIALATAPAPALSIVREFKTDGPVTKTLIPMAALDDIVGCVVFFTTIAVIAGKLSAGSMPAYMIALVVILPLVIGIVCGFLSGFILRRDNGDGITLALLIVIILFTSVAGFFFNPVLGIAMILVILNLGAPLDYHLILGAGMFTAVYILSRALGKYFGAYFGAAVTKSPQTVKKYLGFTLLPHSGVSLVFTGIAVSVLSGSAPECAQIIQGTIAAAAVINEIIAVIMAKKGFEWAGELNQSGADNALEEKASAPLVITISRQYGSGGRDIAMKLSKDLGIPFYDKEIIEMAAQTSSIERSFFENYETDKSNKVLNELASNVTNHYSLDDRVFEHNVKTIRRIAETLLTQSHPAVMATNPAREPLKVMDTSGLP